MQWVVDNWIWILFGGGMIAMHMFGHGKHGGHGSGHGSSSQEGSTQAKDKPCCGQCEKEPASTTAEKPIAVPKSVAGIGAGNGPSDPSDRAEKTRDL